MPASHRRSLSRTALTFAVFVLLTILLFAADRMFPDLLPLPGLGEASQGLPVLRLLLIMAGILALFECFTLVNKLLLCRRRKPPLEGMMVGRVYRLASSLFVVLAFAYGLGVLGAFGTAFAAFGGMLLGWSLQAPVSGFAAWILVSIKRPFRPGDRVQMPQLGLTGDVKDVGLMYTTLDQVGGSIGSEEAVGRHILVPNAMLFSQVVINYTVSQEAAYMLDEVVIRITYDSDWEEAERILISAATEMTGDVIAATGNKPYVRSDVYDYGIYLRLRYQTRAKERVETSYRIQKRVFEGVRRTHSVDMAIPFVYSYRAVLDRKESDAASAAMAAQPPQFSDKEARNIRHISIDTIHAGGEPLELQDIEQVARSIEALGLLQPVVVVKTPDGSGYELMAGHLRLAACRKLGWKAVPAVVLDSHRNGQHGL